MVKNFEIFCFQFRILIKVNNHGLVTVTVYLQKPSDKIRSSSCTYFMLMLHKAMLKDLRSLKGIGICLIWRICCLVLYCIDLNPDILFIRGTFTHILSTQSPITKVRITLYYLDRNL